MLPLILLCAIGTVWAAASATTGGLAGIPEATPVIASQPAVDEDTALLANDVQSSGPLTWSWSGDWGSIDSQAMYKVDLDEEPAADRYFLGVYLIRAASGFASLQLQLRIAAVGPGGTCDAGVIEAASDPDNARVMVLDRADAQVTFAGVDGGQEGLPGATTYCVGVADYEGAGIDPAGTFIRSAGNGSFAGAYPHFVAALNRAS
jgi:hypothetical protein